MIVNKSGRVARQSIPTPVPGSSTPTSTPMPASKSGTIKVKLVDALSGQTISDTNVKIYSDNGVRCIQAPCPTEGQEWTGKSDSDGIVVVPSGVINAVTNITATGYRAGRDLNADSEKITSNDWSIELDPDSKDYILERRLKLIDAQTQKPVANIPMWIVRNENCRPPQCSDYGFTGTTNALGNVYYPIRSIGVQYQNTSWVVANGYKPAKYRLGWGNYRVVLEKEI